MREKFAGKRARTFCIINGTILEYTELIEVEEKLEDPTVTCEYDDAKYLGQGFFHHFDDY